MKTRLIPIILIVLISMLVAGCTAPATQIPATQVPPTQPPPTQIPPTPVPATEVPPTQPPASQKTPQAKLNKEIVLNMVDKLNKGDVEGSLAYFADDAKVYLWGFPPTGVEHYSGIDQIRPFWADMAANNFQWEAKITGAWGDQVNAQVKTWHDFTRQLGVAPLNYIDLYELRDGKIVLYLSWLTEESLARFKPAFAAAVPPEPTATPSSDPPVSEMTVTFANDTCTTDGPLTLRAGEIKMNVIVNQEVKYQDDPGFGLQVFTLDPGKDLLDLMVSTGQPVTASWGDLLLDWDFGPGTNESKTFSVEQGPVYLICWFAPPIMAFGNAGPIEVVP